ncbi:MAG: DUF1553 domain-containing protein [Acidobacteria bacterium]|nr:DUF1553 domain-containing protein [Acidobacteriota bacterium]
MRLLTNPLLKAVLFTGAALAILSLRIPASADDKVVTAADCSFLVQPDEFLLSQSRARQAAHTRASKLERPAQRASSVDPASIPRRNFIDEEIFGRLQSMQVRSAPLAGDDEFLRRVMLDLTGRIPSPEDVRAFVSSADPDKRAALIDKLIASPEFVDKWAWWFADLLQVNATASNVNRQINGRNAFYQWIKVQVAENTSIGGIAYQAVSASGSNYLMESGAVNFVINSTTPMGPIQDQYDTMLAKTASAFLGLGYYDCLLCHNGRGHLDQLSLWGRSGTRIGAQRMAAFFSRQQISNHPAIRDNSSFYFNSLVVTDRDSGDYALNTTNGNRPPRCAPGASVVNNRCTTTMNLEPEYQSPGAKPGSSQNWREAFAGNMVADPMFARNFANRFWRELFNLGLVDPVDAMDPARLDPGSPPPDPWTLQATHPALLEKLAQELRNNGYNLRGFLKLLVNSSAYQISSRYGPDWKYEYTPLFARHYPRRLEGEEIHDAITKATGVMPAYTVQNFPAPVNWALQLPDPSEPRSSGAVVTFLSAFVRGNRDSQQRSQAGSILQQLNLMNDNTVLSRNKVGASPALRALAANTNNPAVVEEMFLLFLGRKPSDLERNESLGLLSRAASQDARNTAIEDLAWALMNKVEFMFSY